MSQLLDEAEHWIARVTRLTETGEKRGVYPDPIPNRGLQRMYARLIVSSLDAEHPSQGSVWEIANELSGEAKVEPAFLYNLILLFMTPWVCEESDACYYNPVVAVTLSEGQLEGVADFDRILRFVLSRLDIQAEHEEVKAVGVGS